MEITKQNRPKVVVANPYTGQETDITPIFDLVHLFHDPIEGPDSFASGSKVVLDALNVYNCALASPDCGNPNDLYDSSSLLAQVALAFLACK